ncbi:hypothetical protein QQ045_012771 [Rhodiola kirilowii]
MARKTTTVINESEDDESEDDDTPEDGDESDDDNRNQQIERLRPKTTIHHLRRRGRFKHRILTIKARSIMHRVFWLGEFYLLKVLMVARRRYTSRSMSSRTGMTQSTH